MNSQAAGKTKILLGMSGGLDSTIAALFLKEAGYEVIGLTLKTWHYSPTNMEKSIAKAKEAAKMLGIDHHIMDIQNSFKQEVIDYFCKEYMTGRTPNPCNRCNPRIKWPSLLEKAEQLGCEYIATGHYVQKELVNSHWHIKKGADSSKDQSYFLWNLTQETLGKALFPLGQFSKKQVREIALKNGLHSIARQKESMGVCFLDGNDYRDFIIEQYGPMAIQPGNIVDENAKILGQHNGIAFFTIGQKKGLGLSHNDYFVVRLDAQKNQVIVSKSASLKEDKIILSTYHLTNHLSENEKRTVSIRIRGIDSVPAIPGVLKYDSSGKLEVNFAQPARGITPGQSIVFYQDDIVVGGGII